MSTPAENLITNQGNVTNSSTFTIDNVIFSDKRTLTVNNTISTTAQQFTITTGINQYGRPLGIYSTDSETTWNDMGGPSNPQSSLLAHATKPSLEVTPLVSSTGVITINVLVNSTIGSGSTFSLVVATCLLAVDSPGSLPSLPTLAGKTARGTVTNTAGTVRYRQIQAKGIYTMPSTVGSPYYETVAHNLGYVPTVNCWNNDTLESSQDYLQATLYTAGGNGVLVDSTNLYFLEYYGSAEYLYRCYQS